MAVNSSTKAAEYVSSISGVNLDPLKQAEGQITSILLENGGQFIIGGAFSNITGTDKDDVIIAGPNSSVNGGAGDDIISGSFLMDISGGAGNDRISVGSGSTIEGGDGNDTISAAFENTVIGGVGNDAIVASRNNTVDAGAGDDTISAGVGNTITGGAGNDKITIGGNQAELGSTVKFAVGDGQDSITLLRSSSTLELGEGFTAANTKVTISDNKATISFDGNDTDGISVNFFLGSALTLSFADGSTLEVKPADKAPSLVSSYGQV
ncbi:calcium-binding protein [Rhizobium leguminosarum]|uniref:calcium-binding protein n=1 Tax=Rhizobium leguminosarum TaxID=384 RepID=UPI0021BC19E3|nr:calcium-binding protein [Rhizobium leguminosarum]